MTRRNMLGLPMETAAYKEREDAAELILRGECPGPGTLHAFYSDPETELGFLARIGELVVFVNRGGHDAPPYTAIELRDHLIQEWLDQHAERDEAWMYAFQRAVQAYVGTWQQLAGSPGGELAIAVDTLGRFLAVQRRVAERKKPVAWWDMPPAAPASNG